MAARNEGGVASDRFMVRSVPRSFYQVECGGALAFAGLGQAIMRRSLRRCPIDRPRT
jgi:hypothetical protein